jgi:serine/threonine protein kinase
MTGAPAEPDPEVDATIVVKRRPGQAARLLAEAAHLRAVAGDGVVPLRRIARDGAEVELHLEAAAGSLADVLLERGRLFEPEVRAVGVAAAAALTRLHEAGLVHADVKPANLLLSSDGELWLADLDAARRADGRPLPRGTPGRARSDAAATPAVDVVALAVMVVELATGVVPDPSARWTRQDLIGLECPPGLAADIATVLSVSTPPTLAELADRLGRGDRGDLPAPARLERRADPTPTLDFDPVVSAPTIRPRRSARPDDLSLMLIVLVLVALAVVAAGVAL